MNGDLTWLNTVDTGQLPDPAREALERGTPTTRRCSALRWVVPAEVQRGS